MLNPNIQAFSLIVRFDANREKEAVLHTKIQIAPYTQKMCKVQLYIFLMIYIHISLDFACLKHRNRTKKLINKNNKIIIK